MGDTCYSPAECNGTRSETITGNPVRKHVSTSYVERQNLTMRMYMCRFTRLTNAFSKKLENHVAGLAALHVLQLRAHPPDAARYARYGGWRDN